MKTYKRALSKAQAVACENAKHPKCRCRCGGALHGKGHSAYQAQEREILDQGKQITTEQITAIVESLKSVPSNPGPTVREVEEVYRTESWTNPGTCRGWETIEKANQKTSTQGKLPLEVG